MQQNHPSINGKQAKRIIFLLAGSVALMMTGFGIILPIFARRLGELGSGVEALGLITVAFALSQMIAAPLAGSLADRYGRRPLVLLALGSLVITNLGYLLATSVPTFIMVRFLGGLLSAGLFPAAMGIVADITPEKEHGKWIGMVMGGFALGIVLGPVMGGFLYDSWGFSAPFIVSAALALIAFSTATILVPETRPVTAHTSRSEPSPGQLSRLKETWLALPRPLHVLGILLFIDFAVAFAFAYIEPQMVFYLYDNLGWSTVQFGVVVGAYGLAMLVGQTMLGHLSDRFGRRPIILIGILLNSLLYPTIAFVTYYPLILANAALAGLGTALLTPALSASYLDIALPTHRSRVMGLKEAVLALGNVTGPLMVVVAAGFFTAQTIFLSAGILVVSTALLPLALPGQLKQTQPDDNRQDFSTLERSDPRPPASNDAQPQPASPY